jgi:TrmH family RNA methyltransferase
LAVAELRRAGVDGLAEVGEGPFLFLGGVQDPGNLGAIARVAEAFGARALLLGDGTAHPNHPRALRASAGSLLRLPVAVGASAEGVTRRFPSSRWAELAAHDGEPLPDRAPPGSWVLALGGERGRLGDNVRTLVERRWTIPLAAPVESLNVAVAAGIALYVLRARAVAP